MKLYYSKGACSLSARIIINDIGIACEFESVDLKNKRTESGKDFLTINPKGAVPVLVLDNGEFLTENLAIQQYLAESNYPKEGAELFPPMGNLNRYRVIEWLSFISSDLHKSFSPLFSSEAPQEVMPFFINVLKKKLSFVDNCLKNKSYLVDNKFTLPDAYLFVLLTWLAKVGIEISDFPNLTRYHEELKKRPSIVKSLMDEAR